MQEILGIGITTDTKEKILEEVEKYLKSYNIKHKTYNKINIKPHVIFTPNPEIIAYAQKNQEFKRVVASAQINLPDGRGVVWALKKLHNIDTSQVAGADFVQDLCKLAARKGYTVGLIGGRGGVAVEALECLRKSHKNLKGWGEEGPNLSKFSIFNFQFSNKSQNKNFQKEIKLLAQEIARKNTRIVFVGMGFPKQEFFIDRLTHNPQPTTHNHPLVLMSVGGTFDYLAGRTPRAPRWMRERGLEWLFRLIREPRRLKRQILGAKFFLDVLRK